MANNPNTFDLISNNPIIAKQHLQQLLTFWTMIGNPDPADEESKLLYQDEQNKITFDKNETLL